MRVSRKPRFADYAFFRIDYDFFTIDYAIDYGKIPIDYKKRGAIINTFSY